MEKFFHSFLNLDFDSSICFVVFLIYPRIATAFYIFFLYYLLSQIDFFPPIARVVSGFSVFFCLFSVSTVPC